MELYDPTIEDTYRKQMAIDDEISVLHIVDTAGQEDFVALRDYRTLRDFEGCAMVFSITSRASFEQVDVIMNQAKQLKEQEFIPGVLIGCKSDLEEHREVLTKEGLSKAKQLQYEYIEASAKTRVNVEESFSTLVRAIRLERTKRVAGHQRATQCIIV